MMSISAIYQIEVTGIKAAFNTFTFSFPSRRAAVEAAKFLREHGYHCSEYQAVTVTPDGADALDVIHFWEGVEARKIGGAA